MTRHICTCVDLEGGSRKRKILLLFSERSLRIFHPIQVYLLSFAFRISCLHHVKNGRVTFRAENSAGGPDSGGARVQGEPSALCPLCRSE